MIDEIINLSLALIDKKRRDNLDLPFTILMIALSIVMVGIDILVMFMFGSPPG